MGNTDTPEGVLGKLTPERRDALLLRFLRSQERERARRRRMKKAREDRLDARFLALREREGLVFGPGYASRVLRVSEAQVEASARRLHQKGLSKMT